MPWTNKSEIQLRTRNALHGTSTKSQKAKAENGWERLILTVVYIASSTEPELNISVLSTFFKLKLITVVSE